MRRAEVHAQREAAIGRCLARRFEEPRLADARGALDEQHAAAAPQESRDQRELLLAL
jgi:hypothetical protein